MMKDVREANTFSVSCHSGLNSIQLEVEDGEQGMFIEGTTEFAKTLLSGLQRFVEQAENKRDPKQGP